MTDSEKLIEILEILKKLMNCPNVSSKPEISLKLIDDIISLLPQNLNVKKYDFNGFPSLVISNTKENNFDVVFCTHIDVVPCEKYQYKEDEVNVYGRGSFDMKGAVSVCLSLFKHLDTDKKVALFITSDEEIAGACAKALVNIYPNIKLAIVPDGGKNFNLICEEKGLFQIKLKVKTKASHASEPYNGQNAITTLFDCYNNLIKKYPLPQNEDEFITSICLSKLDGGKALNQVPDYAEMILDIRRVYKDKKEEILDEIKKINSKIEVEIVEDQLSFITDVNNDYIKDYLKISESILGEKTKIVKAAATSDAIYFSEKNIPTVLTNPVGDFAHCENEYVEKESLLKLYKIFEKVLKEMKI